MRVIVRLAYILTIFILIDLTATIYWIAQGLAHEANPLMGFFLESSPLLFVIAKLGLSGVGIGILCFFRKRFPVIIFKVMLGLNVIYCGVVVYHIWGLLFLLLTTN